MKSHTKFGPDLYNHFEHFTINAILYLRYTVGVLQITAERTEILIEGMKFIGHKQTNKQTDRQANYISKIKQFPKISCYPLFYWNFAKFRYKTHFRNTKN